jgi:adenine-specific DNA-methyltransferase
MAKTTKKSSSKRVEALKHEKARRINVPTAELQSLAEQQEEVDPRPPVHYSRARPLTKGEIRERDADLDPQIVWKGIKITLTKGQAAQLADTGAVEIGDAQLVWRGKDRQDWSDLVVNAPMLYVQEKVQPKAIIDELKRRSDEARQTASDAPDLFADFNGLADPEARAEFYQHSMHWQNRMILGDSLQVMASLAEREALKGKVQCVYFDPPYGIRFNSNWQVSTLSRDVQDGKRDAISREPEQVKAFRDTWRDSIHSYLTYLRDRLIVARELLTDSGSIFIQIGDENVHVVRAVLDEVFGKENLVSQIGFKKTAGQTADLLAGTLDYVLCYAKVRDAVKYRPLFREKAIGGVGADKYQYFDDEIKGRLRLSDSETGESKRLYAIDTLVSQRPPGSFEVTFQGETFRPRTGYWKTHLDGVRRLDKAARLLRGGSVLMYRRYLGDFPAFSLTNYWDDTSSGASQSDPKVYVVQTGKKVVERCILMSTDPGDLVLDPTCGSGTTATVAEQWGRRWITIDTSRVALALARTRLMSARYPYFLLADSSEGRGKEQEITGRIQLDTPTTKDIRHGFVYERVPHVTLKSIANNAEIDVIWETWQRTLEPLRESLNKRLKRNEPWGEWQIPRAAGDPWPEPAAKLHAAASDRDAADKRRQTALQKLNAVLKRGFTLDTLPDAPVDLWTDQGALKLHTAWWEARIARQREIDASIARAADVEFLYDRPYIDSSRVRVAGPFTVESLSPHRVVTSRDDSLGNELAAQQGTFQRGPKNVPELDFGVMVLDNLRTAGVHQKDKKDAIKFASLEPWPGTWIAAEGRYTADDGRERRAAIFIGPEFGTVTRADLTAAAREASEARFDVLIACAFSYDAHATELSRLGPLAILKARMNPDLHMAGELKNTGKGNLFVVFGEPDIDLVEEKDGQIRLKVNGIDVFDPATGEIRSDDTKGIACWFIDIDYNEESFFVRHAYFLGANDPYQSLKKALRAEIDEDAWATLYSDTSRPFPRPSTGRIAVKVINHFGDEVLKVFGA